MNQGKFRIYRNLHKQCFSILKYDNSKGGYRLHAHEKEIFLPSAEFKVYDSGRNRVLLEGRKNVHAYIICEQYSTKLPTRRISTEIYYNPYSCKSFVYKDDNSPVFKSNNIILKNTKCYIFH